MMRILLSPQFSESVIDYVYLNDSIVVTVDGVTSLLDFNSLPDGVMIREETNVAYHENPIISAKRINGELSIELLNYLSVDTATYDELYTTWIIPAIDVEYEMPSIVHEVLISWQSEQDRLAALEEANKPTLEQQLQQTQLELEQTKEQLMSTEATLDSFLTDLLPGIMM